MYSLVCLITLIPVVHSTCYGSLGEPVMKKDGKF